MHHINNMFLYFQATLDDIKYTWNIHRIRPYRQAVTAHGRPILLHATPSIYGNRECGIELKPDEVRLCEEELAVVPRWPCSEQIHELCTCILEENGTHVPDDHEDILDLYSFPRNDILDSL